MFDLSKLAEKVDGLVSVVSGIKKDYVFLDQEIVKLKVALDAAKVNDVTVQASVDAITEKVSNALGALILLDESVVPEVPPVVVAPV